MKRYSATLYVRRYEQFEFELLPCPACRSDELIIKGDENFEFWVKCYTCGTRSRVCVDPLNLAENWNWRGDDTNK